MKYTKNHRLTAFNKISCYKEMKYTKKQVDVQLIIILGYKAMKYD